MQHSCFRVTVLTGAPLCCTAHVRGDMHTVRPLTAPKHETPMHPQCQL